MRGRSLVGEGVHWACLAASLLTVEISWGRTADPPLEFDQGPVLALAEENDFVDGTDRWYTQGAKISFFQGDNHLPGWSEAVLDFLPEIGFNSGAKRIGYGVGQSMYTPANTHAAELLVDDRPFAGWLYGSLVLQRRGLGAGQLLTAESFELQLGIVGPGSYAEQVQTWYHTRTSLGWAHQLKDEPGFLLRYGRSWLVPLGPLDSRFFDFVPEGGVSLGNVDTSFRAGGMVRLGWNLPQDFGPRTIDSTTTAPGGWSPSREGRRWGGYLFTGVEGKAVLYSVFLDGNTWRASHHIDKEPFVGEWRGGAVLIFDRLELTYTHLLCSRAFEGQPHPHVFGAITLNVRF